MAEYVQQSLEQMMPELEQLQRVQILSKEEVKALLKRRQRFEYSIQKREKKKEDFLQYIQYEIAVYDLIQIRRQKVGYFHKKSEIDLAVARRVNKLFKILERRFAKDKNIWLSHIEFLKKMKWLESVGKIFGAMLKLHSTDAGAWIAAAKFHFEEMGNSEDARNTLLQGLRFNKQSQMLYREYFRFELLYLERLRKRAQILGLLPKSQASDATTTEDNPNMDKNKEADEELLTSETGDAVLNGQIVIQVAKTAMKECSDVNFAVSLLNVAMEFEFVIEKEISDVIISELKNSYSTSALTWDSLARFALYDKETPTRERIEKCQKVYQEGLKELSKSEEERRSLMKMNIDTFMGLASEEEEEISLLATKALIEAFKMGDESGLLEEGNYKDWISIVDEKEKQIIKKSSNCPSF